MRPRCTHGRRGRWHAWCWPSASATPSASSSVSAPTEEDPCTANRFEFYVPEVNGCVTTEGQPDSGAAIVYDADTREPLGTLEDLVGESSTPSPGTTAPGTPTLTPGPSAGSGGGDIDCDQVDGPIYVGSNDPHDLDGDGDGWGCEE